jgi:hypothetical protein
VSDGDAIGANVSRHAPQKIISEPTRRIFTGQSLRERISLDIEGFDVKRPLHVVRDRATKRFVSAGRGAQLVVQVGKTDKAEFPVFGQITQQYRQGHGVRTAGQANQDAAARRQETVPLNSPPDLLVKRGHKDRPGDT